MMRKLMTLAAMLAALAAPAAAVETRVSSELNRSAASSFNYDINVADLQRFSLQVGMADSAPASPTFIDGDFASLTLTVADYSALHGQASSMTITVMSGQNEALSGTYIEINGRRYAEGSQWVAGYTSTRTATNIAEALDAHWEYSATASSNIITVVAANVGTYANSWTKATSNAAKLGVTAWSAGQEYSTIFFNGTTLTEGTNYTAQTSTHVTANAIAVAINDNAAIAAVVSVSSSADLTGLGVLTLTAKVSAATEYPLSVSNAVALVPSKNRLTGGAASPINVAGDYITSSTQLPTGLPVLYTKVSGTAIGGLTDQTTYYAIARDGTSFKLASSANNADAGTAIDITGVTGAGSHKLEPLALTSAANDGIKYKGSNDGSTWYDLSTTTVPYDATSSGGLSTFVDYTAKWLRVVFTKPTTGALTVTATLNGRK